MNIDPKKTSGQRLASFKTHALHTGKAEITLRLYTENAETPGLGSVHEITIEHKDGESRTVQFLKLGERDEKSALADFESFEKSYISSGHPKISGWINFSAVFNAMAKNAAISHEFSHAMHYRIFREWRKEQNAEAGLVKSPKKKLLLG